MVPGALQEVLAPLLKIPGSIETFSGSLIKFLEEVPSLSQVILLARSN